MLVLMAAAWIAAGCLLSASWYNARQNDRVWQARGCSEDEIFTTVPCRVTLVATVVRLTRSEAEFDVRGRRLLMPVMISGDMPATTGALVRVTLYGGVPIRLEGQRRHYDAVGSAAERANAYRFFGLFILVGSLICTPIPIGSLWLRLASRRRSGPER